MTENTKVDGTIDGTVVGNTVKTTREENNLTAVRADTLGGVGVAASPFSLLESP